jgi:hypothetical protein
MCRYSRILAVLLAVLLGLVWITPLQADEALSADEAAELTARKKDDLYNKQLKGLAACVLAVFCVSVVFWALSTYNKSKKRDAAIARKQALQEGNLWQQTAAPVGDPPPMDMPLEPPPSDW